MQLMTSGLGTPAGTYRFFDKANPTEAEMAVEVTVGRTVSLTARPCKWNRNGVQIFSRFFFQHYCIYNVCVHRSLNFLRSSNYFFYYTLLLYLYFRYSD